MEPILYAFKLLLLLILINPNIIITFHLDIKIVSHIIPQANHPRYHFLNPSKSFSRTSVSNTLSTLAFSSTLNKAFEIIQSINFG